MKNINAKEILEIAVRNEKNGVKFYSELAKHAKDAETKKTLIELSKQENGHITAVKRLINTLLEENSSLSYYDDPEELLYLQAIADATLFTDNLDSPVVKAAASDFMAALHYAVDVEIKSIEFYQQVLKVMTPDSGQKTIEELIEQEKGHVTTLHKMIKEH